MRLIDADKAIKEYEETRQKLIEMDADLFREEIDELDYIIRQFKLQPTAYDVEAVVRELGELFNAYLENVLIQREREERHYVNAMHIFEKTIEIVERGGRNE